MKRGRKLCKYLKRWSITATKKKSRTAEKDFFFVQQTNNVWKKIGEKSKTWGVKVSLLHFRVQQLLSWLNTLHTNNVCLGQKYVRLDFHFTNFALVNMKKKSFFLAKDKSSKKNKKIGSSSLNILAKKKTIQCSTLNTKRHSSYLYTMTKTIFV